MSDEKLTQVFDLTPVEKVEVVKTPIPDNKEADIETARQVHHELLDTSKDALQNLLDFAKASESPRAYEIVSDLIRTTSDVAKTLVDINTKYKNRKIKHFIDGNNYKSVYLYCDEKNKIQYRVHRLVAKYFLENGNKYFNDKIS